MKSIREYFKFHNSFKGRINRKAYIVNLIKELFVLLLYTGSFFMSVVSMEHLESKVVVVPCLIIMGIMFFIVCITTATSQITSLVKRLQDLNFSSYWILLIFFLQIALNVILRLIDASIIQVPFLVEIIILLTALILFLVCFIYLFCIKGTKGDNKYGPDPLQEGNLNIPKLSKKVLLLVIGLPVISLIALSSIVVIKKGVKGGLEEMQKTLEEAGTAIEERQIEKKEQGEFLKKKLEGVLEGDTEERVEEGMEESTDTEQVE